MLAIVQYQQQIAGSQEPAQSGEQGLAWLLVDSQHAGHRTRHQLGTAGGGPGQRGKLDQPHPLGVRRHPRRRHPQREPCLAGAARTGKRDQPGHGEEIPNLRHLPCPPHEAAPGRGQIGSVRGVPRRRWHTSVTSHRRLGHQVCPQGHDLGPRRNVEVDLERRGQRLIDPQRFSAPACRRQQAHQRRGRLLVSGLFGQHPAQAALRLLQFPARAAERGQVQQHMGVLLPQHARVGAAQSA